MFGRRTDFSWLLILLLVGIFVLSLKVPRQWELHCPADPLRAQCA